MRNHWQYEKDGLTVRQLNGPAIAVYFDWDSLPPIDLEKEYYLVEIIPRDGNTPTEMASPNSRGPLHFYLKDNIVYDFYLVSVPIPRVEIQNDPQCSGWCELIPQHEMAQMLVWGGIDETVIESGGGERWVSIHADGKYRGRVTLFEEQTFYIQGRPGKIEVSLNDFKRLFSIRTNLQIKEIKRSFSFQLKPEDPKIFLSTIVNPSTRERRLLAEIPVFSDMRRCWVAEYLKAFPEADETEINGYFRFFEDAELTSEIRGFGFSTKIRTDLVENIIHDEWRENQDLAIEEYKLQLQLSSPHRELFKYVLLEKHIEKDRAAEPIGFSKEELEEAKRILFEANSNVRWDPSFIELVLFFKVTGYDWQEFQRDTAQSNRWEYQPEKPGAPCRVEWVLRTDDQWDSAVSMLRSGIDYPKPSLGIVVLRPYNAVRLFACWDLDESRVRGRLKEEWGVTPEEVGFYLKVHEEYHGSRTHRGDRDCPIVDLFSPHRNIYFDVEPDKCFSVEIVARYQTWEIALTPVSGSVVTPKPISAPIQVGHGRERFALQWRHPSQREILHREGKDNRNNAKALIHLHMHSPNLFRIDPFRDSYLRSGAWPVRLSSGEDVHNPPGEWVYRNCLDSWLPILRSLRNLASRGIDYQISMDISPPVAYMLNSARFKDYMSRYLKRSQARAKGQISLMRSHRDDPAYIRAAERYLADLEAIDQFYNHELTKDMLGAFRDLESRGYLEIISCTATHGMAAELQSIPDALNTQVVMAQQSHHRLFGHRPKGIWLAENSYFPGVESFLENEGLAYFFVESEAVLYGSHCPVEEEYNPVCVPNTEMVAFGRSRLGRIQVWDAKLGYAGHPDFREYHFRHRGLPVKRITSKTTMDKQPYNADKAEETARRLAWDFHHKLSAKGYEISRRNFQSIPLISCTYDAELFGHHWSEGPIFLEELLTEFYQKGDAIGLTTPSHYLAAKPSLPAITPNPSTWGHEAVHVKWTDPKVAWTFIEFEKADKTLRDYLGNALNGQYSEFQKRAVLRMAAEFIRSQSSDLTFVIMSDAFEEDMRREILKYLNYFYRLKYLIDNNIQDEDWLNFREIENDMFSEISDFYQIL